MRSNGCLQQFLLAPALPQKHERQENKYKWPTNCEFIEQGAISETASIKANTKASSVFQIG